MISTLSVFFVRRTIDKADYDLFLVQAIHRNLSILLAKTFDERYGFDAENDDL